MFLQCRVLWVLALKGVEFCVCWVFTCDFRVLGMFGCWFFRGLWLWGVEFQGYRVLEFSFLEFHCVCF